MNLLGKNDSVHDLKMWNLRNIMVAVLAKGKLTKQEMLESTGLSASTVSDCVGKLVALGALGEAGWEESSGGRRAARYRVEQSFGAFLGVELTENIFSFALCDMTGCQLSAWQQKLSPDELALHTLCKGIERGMAEAPISLRAIGLALPGALDTERGIVLRCAALHWRNVPIKENLERRYGFSTDVDHPVHCGAMRAEVLGAAQGLQNFLCAWPHHRHKVAVVLDGSLCRGRGNLCGTLEEPWEPEGLQALARLLGLEQVLVGPAGEPFPGAAALMAEMRWFEQLYQLIKENRND